MTRKVGELLCPFPWGKLSLYVTQSRRAEAYLHTKWHPDPPIV